MLPRLLFVAASTLPLLAIAVGCEESKPNPKAKTREIIGKTTQDVRNLKVELAKGGQVSDGKVHATDYLTLQSDVYKTQIAKGAQLRVTMDMMNYETANGEKPKTYEEFMEHIIKKGKPDGIQLPMLPYNQEYAYDPDKYELVVINYPERTKAVGEAWDKELGRKK
jgi:hypothetical protein